MDGWTVGEPTDEACRIEGIICNIMEERRQLKNKLVSLANLEKKQQANLRLYFQKEAEEQEERRKQANLEQEAKAVRDQQKSIAEALLEEEDDIDIHYDDPPNSVVQVTPPHTPPGPLLEMSPSSQTSAPETPGSPRTTRRQLQHEQQRQQPYQCDLRGTRVTSPLAAGRPAPTKDNKKQTTHATGITWEENIIGTGCDLFWCATMPLCVSGSASAAVIPDLTVPAQHQFHSHPLAAGIHSTSSLLQETGGVHQHYLWQRQQQMHQDENDGQIHRADSYGNGSILSTGNSTTNSVVDFSTGLSGHMALSRGRRRQMAPQRKQVRMMSQHDGIAHIRRKQKGQKSLSSDQSVEGTIATL